MKHEEVPISWKSGEANQDERPARVVVEFGDRKPYSYVYRVVEKWDPEDGSLISVLERSRPDAMGADSWRVVRDKPTRWGPLVAAVKALAMRENGR